MEKDPNRGTGRSTRQMLNAPQDSYYVLGNMRTASVYRDMARQIGRDDLKFVSIDFILSQKFRGTRNYIEVDHYVYERLRGLSSSIECKFYEMIFQHRATNR